MSAMSAEQVEASLAALGRRFRCALPVTLRRRSQDLELLTGDVSLSGAFVRSSDCPPKNSLIRLVFTLPPDDTKLTVSGSVLHVVSSADRNPNEYPGFAVQFVGFAGPAKERWEQLVRPLSRDPGAERKKTLVFAAPTYVERFRSAGPVTAELELRPTMDQLQALVGQEIPGGTLFVPSAAAVAPGASVVVRVVHPLAQESFPLEGTARRPDGDAAQGVDVRLVELTAEGREALVAFRDSVMVVDDYDIEVLEAPEVGS
jgi:hypothetical protein